MDTEVSKIRTEGTHAAILKSVEAKQGKYAHRYLMLTFKDPKPECTTEVIRTVTWQREERDSAPDGGGVHILTRALGIQANEVNTLDASNAAKFLEKFLGKTFQLTVEIRSYVNPELGNTIHRPNVKYFKVAR